MDGQHQNLERTGYEGATEIVGEQTGMEECCAERVQPSDRGRLRTEQIKFKRNLSWICMAIVNSENMYE